MRSLLVTVLLIMTVIGIYHQAILGSDLDLDAVSERGDRISQEIRSIDPSGP